MIKQIAVYLFSFSIVFLSIYLLENHFLNIYLKDIRYNLFDTNLFFCLASFFICLHLLIFSNIKLVEPFLGYIYLPTLFIKGVLFYLIFKDSVFNIDNLTTLERLNLLVPMLIYLIVEVLFIIKILNSKTGKI
jgi:hypothetical protein